MAKGKKNLFKLVKSLEKEEKRYFRIFAKRTKGGQEARFVKLFELLDKAAQYDEDVVRRKLGPQVSRSQFANLKRHLYQTLLTSLRLQLVSKHIDLQIREQIDFARILYSKGHYMESLNLLERIKQVAKANNQDILHLEVLEFQKFIEARHITRSRQVAKKMDRLLEESTLRSMVTQTASVMTNLNIQMHGYYIEHGFAITEADRQELDIAWRHMQPEQFPNRFQDTFFEKTHRVQAFMWYRYVLADLKGALRHASEWVNLFRINHTMTTQDPDLYMRGLYYLMVFHFLQDDLAGFEEGLSAMSTFIKQEGGNFNKNSEQVAFIYQELSILNHYIIRNDFRQGLAESRRILNELPKHAELVDPHRIMLLDFKFAAIRFALGRYQSARSYLSNLLHYRKQILRHDIDINARLLELMCLFETREIDFMSSRLNSLARSLGKDKTATPLQKQTLALLRDLHRHHYRNVVDIFAQYAPLFSDPNMHPADRIFLKYLDVGSWVRGKL